MPKQITIQELNPQRPPEAIPGLTTSVMLGQGSGTMRAIYRTMAVTRPIQISAGTVLIVDEGRPEAAASNLTLPAPPRRYGFEPGADGSTLRIVSGCNYTHTVRTPPNAIDGHASLITFLKGFGAVELYAQNGRWVTLSSANVVFE